MTYSQQRRCPWRLSENMALGIMGNMSLPNEQISCKLIHPIYESIFSVLGQRFSPFLGEGNMPYPLWPVTAFWFTEKWGRPPVHLRHRRSTLCLRQR